MTLHPQARVLVAAMETTPAGEPGFGVDEIRDQARRAALAVGVTVPLEQVEDVDAGGVLCRLYRPRTGAPVAVYVHGGGWVLHDLETHDAFCRHLADATGWALFSIDYRRAPEHPFPAPLDDVEAAARWLREHAGELHVDAGFLPAIGDSSGANLIAGLCVRDPSVVDFQVLMYPPTDRRADLALESNAVLDGRVMEWFWEAYAPGDAGDVPEVSVVNATNLADHPPAFLVTCEHDVLRDQGERYGALLAEAGVDVTSWRALGMVHSFWRQPEAFDASRSVVRMVGAQLDSRLETTR